MKMKIDLDNLCPKEINKIIKKLDELLKKQEASKSIIGLVVKKEKKDTRINKNMTKKRKKRNLLFKLQFYKYKKEWKI